MKSSGFYALTFQISTVQKFRNSIFVTALTPLFFIYCWQLALFRPSFQFRFSFFSSNLAREKTYSFAIVSGVVVLSELQMCMAFGVGIF